MKLALWRGRLLTIVVAALGLLTTGCNGLTDQQMSSILQSAIGTALNTLVQTILTTAAGQS